MSAANIAPLRGGPPPSEERARIAIRAKGAENARRIDQLRGGMTTSGAEDFQLAPFLGAAPPKAASFIVTLYGDVMEPRGGALWIGSLIELCERVGISETLVRTAVSRLVGAGQLLGERAGRRSFYRLTPEAAQEYAAAAPIVFGLPEPAAWTLAPCASEADFAALEAQGFARIGGALALGPRPPKPPAPAALMRAAPLDAEALRGFVAAHWSLAPQAAAYVELIARFAPAEGSRPPPPEALALRLLLVHRFRRVFLADPRLPPEVLPEDWPGFAARRLFSRLYLALTPGAEACLAARFVSESGPLPGLGEAGQARMAALRLAAA